MTQRIIILTLISVFLFGCFTKTPVQTEPPKEEEKSRDQEKKDRIFLMGIGMLRLNWAKVRGNEIRFRYSDLGLPADLSTRERASFMLDGTLGHGKYDISGHLNYDPENRITEPPLDFLVTVGNDNQYLSVGDYRLGVFQDSLFSRYYHPFRGGILGVQSKKVGVELIGGMARGEAGIEEIPADSSSGPYYLADAPIIRSSEIVYLVVKSRLNPDAELKRTAMIRNRDYYLDYDRGSLIFSSPVFPTDELGNPVFILVSYQFEAITGRFTRDVLGIRTFYAPASFLKFHLSYIADADGTLPLDEAWKEQRGIYTLGINVDSKPLKFFGEYAFSSDPVQKKQTGLFGGGIATISRKFHLYFNSWSIQSDFPVFANEQLKYGYSLYQLFPSYSERNIFLSPFQFTRNLGAELYPFSLSRISVDEREAHAFAEWEEGKTTVSSGYGWSRKILSDIQNSLFYISSFHDGEKTKLWGKLGFDREWEPTRDEKDARAFDLLLGARRRIWQGKKGGLFIQADYSQLADTDLLNLAPDLTEHQASLFAEYLTGREGYFGGYRKQILYNRDSSEKILDADIYELGVLHHVYKGFFLDTRYRNEASNGDQGGINNSILSLGGGIDSTHFRLQARYEIQMNRQNGEEGKRRLISFYLFGTPFKGMSLNLRYYKQIGGNLGGLTTLNENSEEQLNFRLHWKLSNTFTLYSQWRYDTNIELYPPLDRTKSNSLASVQGLKIRLGEKLEFLANYKLLKIWGPIENKKETAAAELGYLITRHFRLGLGAERIHYRDLHEAEGNYDSTVGYFKLVAVY